MKNKIAYASLILIFAIIQAISLYKIAPKEALETGDLSTIQSKGEDYVYYLNGALSLYQFDPYLKFNDKKQPIAGSKPIAKDDISKAQAYIAILYPFPSFKFGYSLSIAALSLPFGDHFFQKYLPRLSVSNYVFGLIAFIFILLTLRRCTKNIYAPLLFTLIYATDIFSINNNYQYQSHTISGIMYVAIAYYLFFTERKQSKLNILTYFFLISLAILSSSHIVPLALSFAGLLGLNLLLQKESLKEKFYKVLLGAIGFLVLPCYIVLVEKLLNFEALGIPTYFFQIKWYSVVVDQLVSTYPLLERSIWDFRIWNHYIAYIVAPLFALPFLYKVELRASIKSITFKILACELVRNKKLILLIPLICQLVATSFYSQPIVRALVPNLIIYSIFVSILYALFFDKVKFKIAVFSLIFIISLPLLLNLYFYIKLSSADPPYRGEIFSGAPQVIIPLTDQEIIWSRIKEYFDAGGYKELPVGKLGLYSMNLEELFLRLQNVNGINLDSIPENVWLQIRPLDIVESYSHARRFIPEFNNNKRNIVTKSLIEKDFNLYFELFHYMNSGYLSDKSVKVIPIKFWEPRLFDQEYNYIYGYNQRIKKYFTHTDLENIDMRSVYYINLKALYEIYSKVGPIQ